MGGSVAQLAFLDRGVLRATTSDLQFASVCTDLVRLRCIDPRPCAAMGNASLTSCSALRCGGANRAAHCRRKHPKSTKSQQARRKISVSPRTRRSLTARARRARDCRSLSAARRASDCRSLAAHACRGHVPWIAEEQVRGDRRRPDVRAVGKYACGCAGVRTRACERAPSGDVATRSQRLAARAGAPDAARVSQSQAPRRKHASDREHRRSVRISVQYASKTRRRP